MVMHTIKRVRDERGDGVKILASCLDCEWTYTKGLNRLDVERYPELVEAWWEIAYIAFDLKHCTTS